MFDQRSANERKGEIPQAHGITCRHVSSKTHYNCQPLRNSLYGFQLQLRHLQNAKNSIAVGKVQRFREEMLRDVELPWLP